MSSYCLQASMLSDETSSVNLIGFHLYIMFCFSHCFEGFFSCLQLSALLL